MLNGKRKCIRIYMIVLLFLSVLICQAEPSVLHYAFNKEQGTTVSDISGNCNDGKIKNVDRLNENGNNFLRFNGKNSSMTLPPAEMILGKNVSEGTIALWIRPAWDPEELPLKSGDFRYYEVFMHMDRKNGNKLPDGPSGFALYQIKDAAGKGFLEACIPDSGIGGHGRKEVKIMSPLKKGKWTHVTMEWSQPEGFLRLYINGVLESENKAVRDVPLLDDGEAHVGIFKYGLCPFNGDIGEIKIWEKALSDSEIKEEAGKMLNDGSDKRARTIRQRYNLEHLLMFDKPNKFHNLVSNSSFEVGLNEWDRINSSRNGLGKIKWEIDDKTAAHGKQSLKISHSEMLISELWSKSIPVQMQTEYTLSLYAKTDNPDIKTIIANKPVFLTKEWKRHVLKFKELPSNFIASAGSSFPNLFNIAIGFCGKGSVWIDAVQLEEGQPTDYQYPGELDCGIDASTEISDKRFNIYKEGEPVNLLLKLFNGKNEYVNSTVTYTIKDIYSNILQDGKIDFSIPLGGNASKDIAVNLSKRGIFKGKFIINDNGNVSEKEITFAVITPQYNKDKGEDYFFGHSTGTLGECNYEREVSLAEMIGMKYSEAYNSGGHRLYFNDFFKDKNFTDIRISLQDRMQGILEKYNVIRLRTIPRPGVYWKNPLPETLTEEDVESWAKSVEKEVMHFKGRIKYWEICSELVDGGINGRPLYDPKEYVKLLKAAYPAIKKIDPDAIVIGGGTDQQKKFASRAEAVFKEGGLEYMDAVTIHPYCVANSPEKANFAEDLEYLKNAMKRYGKEKDIWVTEVGFPGFDKIYDDFPSKENGILPVSELVQAEYMVRMNIIALGKGVKHFFSFILTPASPTMMYRYHFSFLNYDSPKIVFAAYSAMTEILGNAKFEKEIYWGGLVKCYQFNKNGKPLFVIWNSDEARRPADLEFGLKQQDVNVFDIMGNLIPVSGDKKTLNLEVTGSPLYLELQGISAEEFLNSLSAFKIDGIDPVFLSTSLDRKAKNLHVLLKNQSPEKLEGSFEISATSGLTLGKNKFSFGPINPWMQQDFEIEVENVSLFETYDILARIKYKNDVIDENVILKPADILCEYVEQPIRIDGNIEEWNNIPAYSVNDLVGARKGSSDLDAKIYTAWDAQYFYMAVEVNDDIFKFPPPDTNIWKGDSIQIAFDSSNDPNKIIFDKNNYEYGLGLTEKDVPIVYRWLGGIPGAVNDIKLAVKRTNGKIYYEAAFPAASLGLANIQPVRVIGFNLTVNDNDSDKLDKWLQLAPGLCGSKDSSLFKKLMFIKRK